MRTASTLSRPLLLGSILIAACGTGSGSPADTDTDPPATTVEVTGDSFRCISDMTPVRGFWVDNLLGDLDASVAVAENLEGNTFPPGTVVQLVPQEAMVKREAGFSPETQDWEFFFLLATDEGTTIQTRGKDETVNAFGGNCFDCHAPAADHDLLCEQDHGCAPLPIGPEQFEALVAADPRCD